MARRVKAGPKPMPAARSLRDVSAIALEAVQWAAGRSDVDGIVVFLSDANATKRPALLVRVHRLGESWNRWFEPDVRPAFVRRVLAEACREG